MKSPARKDCEEAGKAGKNMWNFFNPDNAFWSFINRIIDLAVLSLIWALCCLPVITAGPACIALYYAVVKSVRRQRSYCVREFFRAFRINLRKGIAIWLMQSAGVIMTLMSDAPMLFITTGRGGAADILPAAVFVLKLLILTGTGCWMILLQSRYEERVIKLAVAAFGLMFRRLPATVFQTTVLCAGGYLLLGEPLFVCIVPGAAAFLISLSGEPVLRRLCDAGEEEPDRDAWYLEGAKGAKG